MTIDETVGEAIDYQVLARNQYLYGDCDITVEMRKDNREVYVAERIVCKYKGTVYSSRTKENYHVYGSTKFLEVCQKYESLEGIMKVDKGLIIDVVI